MVPVVYMARDLVILMRANQFRGQLEGVGTKNRDFIGTNGDERRECNLGPKSRFSGPTTHFQWHSTWICLEIENQKLLAKELGINRLFIKIFHHNLQTCVQK
jgi:hypothetical protein